jgi:type IV pilus assembly protein PilV
MVEILMAVLILSIGVLGFAGLQLKALQSTGQSFYRSQATILADDILSRMAVNPGQIATYGVAASWANAPVTDPAIPTWWGACRGTGNTCAQTDLAAWDIKQSAWIAAHLLPNGTEQVAQCPSAKTYCVTVAWNTTTVAKCDPSGDTDNDCVVMEVVPQ